MNIVFLGPPGSGKGTQAKRLENEYHLQHLSTGDAFRDAIGHKTALGLEIKSFVDNGKLVPDGLVSRVVFDTVKALNGKPFLLDGYPRTLEQARALTEFSKTSGISIDAVLLLDVSFSEVTKRLSARRSCGKCKEVYNLVNKAPKVDGVCDVCGAALMHRADDQPLVVQDRLVVYTTQTEPIVDFYRSMPIFRRVDGAQDIDKVYREVDAALESLPTKRSRLS